MFHRFARIHAPGTAGALLACSLIPCSVLACVPATPPTAPEEQGPTWEAETRMSAKAWNEACLAREAELVQESDDIDSEVPQTLASAHRFLAKLVARGGITIDAETDLGWNIAWAWQTTLRGKERLLSLNFPLSPVLGASDHGECLTVLRMEVPPDVPHGESGEQVWIESPIRHHVHLPWPEVTFVEQDGEAVMLSGVHTTQRSRGDFEFMPARLRLHLGSEAMATRIAYVFELLSVYCEEKS